MKKIVLRNDARQNVETAKETRLKSHDHAQEMRNLEVVYSLPKEFQYDAAKSFGLLAWYKYNHNGLSYKEDSLATNEAFKKAFVDELCGIAYRKTGWGRKRNIHRGSKVLEFPATMNVESCIKHGYTSYDYYSDYSVFFHRSRPLAIYSFDSGNETIINFADPSDCPQTLFGGIWHIARHPLFNEAIQSGEMEWDMNEIAFVQGSEVYHIKQTQLYVTEEDGSKLFDAISRRFAAWNGNKLEREKKAELQKILDNPPNEITVCVQHSLQAGNCEVGTMQFRKRYGLLEKDCYSIAELKEKNVPIKDGMFQRALMKAIEGQK